MIVKNMDFFIDTTTTLYIWLMIAILFLLLEMGSPGLFFFLSFFFGGLLAAFSSLWIVSMAGQIIVFFIGTIIALAVLHYWIMPLIGKNRSYEHTNVYALTGKKGFVITHIGEKQSGLVKINGITWAARCIHNNNINVGDEVEVIDVKGTHVIVQKV